MHDFAALAPSIAKSHPMLKVADMRASVEWYQSIGFALVDQFEDDGDLIFARVAFGACELALSPGAAGETRNISLWLFTTRIDELYAGLKARRAVFAEDLYVPFYGGRQFSIVDPNGLILIYWHPAWLEEQ